MRRRESKGSVVYNALFKIKLGRGKDTDPCKVDGQVHIQPEKSS